MDNLAIYRFSRLLKLKSYDVRAQWDLIYRDMRLNFSNKVVVSFI